MSVKVSPKYQVVIPEDVRAICHDVLRHRIGLTYEAEAENVTTDEVINEVLNVVEALTSTNNITVSSRSSSNTFIYG